MRRASLLWAALLLTACPKPPAPADPGRGKSAVKVEEEAPLEDLLRQTHRQLQAGAAEEALMAINRILIGRPEHLESRVLQAMALTRSGQAAEAAAVWIQIERILVYHGKLVPFTLEETLEAATLHYVDQGRPERARLFLDELWRRYPAGEVTARTQLGAAQHEAAAGRWPRARQRCAELIRLRPTIPAADRCRRLSHTAQRMLELGPEPPAQAPAWSWQNPKPQGNDLHDVWVGPRGEVTAVGDAGTILQRPAGQRSFVTIPSPTRWSLHRIWGTEQGELWVAGAGGIILHHDGKSWQVARQPGPEQVDLWGIHASTGQVVAVGEGGTVVSGGPGAWSEQRVAAVTLRAVFVDGNGRLLAAGDGGTLLQRGASGWRALGSDCYEDLWSLAGQGNQTFLVGNRRTVVLLEGERARESVIGRADLRDLCMAGPKEAWAVGTAGEIVHFAGGRWRAESSGTLLDLHGVASRRADEVWAVGAGGTILVRRGGRWSMVSGGVHQALVAISPGAGLALGERGLLLRREGAHWKSDAPLPQGRYRDFWAEAGRQIAVGDRGLLAVRAGRGAWRSISTEVVDDLTAVAGYPGGAVVVGTSGTILRLQGETLIRDSSPNGLDLNAVWAGGPRKLVAVGGRGTILFFDGERWAQQESGTLLDLLAVWGLADGPLLAAGAGGTLLQRAGQHWRTQSSPLAQNLVDLWGSSPGRIFAISDRGGVIHFDGSSWQLQRSPSNCLAALGGDAGGVWAVGCRGAIVALHR